MMMPELFQTAWRRLTTAVLFNTVHNVGPGSPREQPLGRAFARCLCRSSAKEARGA